MTHKIKPVIQWEYWKNPLGGGDEYVTPADENDEGFEDVLDNDMHATKVRPVIPTAGGLIPLTVYGSISANFKFWMMHTNFNISEAVRDKLKVFPGVQSLDEVGRYTVRLSFGKCFNATEVRRGIEVMFGVGQPDERARKHAKHAKQDQPIVLDKETSELVDLTKSQLEGYATYWAIYVLPNGELAASYTESGAQFEEFLDLYRQSRELVGGLIFASHDD